MVVLMPSLTPLKTDSAPFVDHSDHVRWVDAHYCRDLRGCGVLKTVGHIACVWRIFRLFRELVFGACPVSDR